MEQEGVNKPTGWLPMETAPRDGSPFLMSYHYRGGASFVTIASAPPAWNKRYAWWRTKDGNIPVVETHPEQYEHSCYPTGWQPLPEPLEVQDSEPLMSEVVADLEHVETTDDE